MKTTINEQSVECIVLKKVPYKENDCLVYLYSKDYGKICTLARGMNKMKSKNARGCQEMVLSEITLNLKKGISSLIRSAPLHYFRHIKEHIESDIVASYILEYYYRYVDENDPDELLYNQLYYSLKALDEGYHPLLVYLVFNIFLLNIHGLSMEVDGCVVCGCTHVVSLSLQEGGFLCESHVKNECYNKQFLKAFRHLNKITIEHIDALHIEDTIIKQLSLMIQSYLEDSTGIKFKSFGFIQTLL